MQDFRSLSAAEIKKIPAVRTMRTPESKSRQLLTQKTGLSQNEAFPEVREIIFIKIAQAAERVYCL